MINMLSARTDKEDNIQDQMSNISREITILEKDQIEVLDIKAL